MDSHDRILMMHNQKMEAHRRWIQQQQDAIQGLAVGAGGSTLEPSFSYRGDSAAHQARPMSPSLSTGAVVGQGQGLSSNYRGAFEATSLLLSSPNSAAPQHQSGAVASSISRKSTMGGGSAAPLTPTSAALHRMGGRGGMGGGSTPKSPNLEDDEYFTTVMGGSPIAVYMRGTQWARRREQKIEEQRLQREQEEAAACTFRPSVDPDALEGSGGSLDRSPGRLGGGDYHHNVVVTDVAPGIAEHLDRLEKARQRLREREEKLNAVGSNWTPETTTPEPFLLGHRRSRPQQPIPALRQPIQAPNRPVLDSVAYRPYLGSSSPFTTGASSISVESLLPPGAFSQRATLASMMTSNLQQETSAKPASVGGSLQPPPLNFKALHAHTS